MPYNKISLRYLKLGVYLSCILTVSSITSSYARTFSKHNKTKQKNSSNVYARTFQYIFFEFSVVASGNKYLGQIRRQLVTILKRQHFTTSRVSNGAGYV